MPFTTSPCTWQRGIIDAIPTEPSTQLPAQAEITLAESPEPGAGHLTFSSASATSFKVLHKGPGEAAFAEVATVLLPGDFTATSLVGGTHEYQIVPHNSRGDGPASAVVSIEVIAVGAPEAPVVSPPESLAPGEVHFQITDEEETATSFQVFHQGPGDSGFTLASTVPAVAGAAEYSANGQAQGVHAYKVRGVNAQGPGAFSAVVSLDVMEAAA